GRVDLLGRMSSGVVRSEDDINLNGDELGGEPRKPFELAVCVAFLDHANVSKLAEAFLKSVDAIGRKRLPRSQYADPRNLVLLLSLSRGHRGEQQKGYNGGQSSNREPHDSHPPAEVSAVLIRIGRAPSSFTFVCPTPKLTCCRKP